MKPQFDAWAGPLLLSVQVVAVIWSLFSEVKYFGWGPHTTQTSFTVNVEIGNRELLPAEIDERYRFDSGRQWEGHGIGNVKAWIMQYEQTYGKRDTARVLLTYRVNGGPVCMWEYSNERSR